MKIENLRQYPLEGDVVPRALVDFIEGDPDQLE